MVETFRWPACMAIFRGRLRRDILAGAESAVEAWISGDRDRFGEWFGELPQQPGEREAAEGEAAQQDPRDIAEALDDLLRLHAASVGP